MFADYQRLVVEYYHQKKGDNKLSSNLMFLTPSNLKEECERVCVQRFIMKDEQVIRDFFGKGGTQKDCLDVIKGCLIGKFKPLINFLNGDTGKTDEKNIFLLAWLLDFPDRPFVLGKRYTSGAAVNSEIKVVERVDFHSDDPAVGWHTSTPIQEGYIGVDDKQIEASDNGSGSKARVGVIPDEAGDAARVIPKRRYRKAVVAVGIFLVVGVAGCLWWYNKTSMVMATGNGGCMYWADYHYQPIPCNKKVPNTLVIALDSAKLRNFKKITLPDTITYRSRGHVWYSKIDNKIEFFTADGKHPIVFDRPLKPISVHIIDKYIHPGMTSSQ